MRQSIRKYSWTPACDNQLENTPGQPRATVNLKILLDNRVQQWIKKYFWTAACDSQLENTSGHPCDSNFPKGVSAISQSFPLKHWNKTNVYERIPHYVSCQQCKPCQQCQQCQQVSTVKAAYSAVLPPSLMVFFHEIPQEKRKLRHIYIGLITFSPDQLWLPSASCFYQIPI